MNLVSAYGLCAHALIFGALATCLPLGELRPKAGLMATTLALLVGIAPVMHAVFGTPSMTIVLWAVWQLAGRAGFRVAERPAWALLAFAALYYPTALGAGPFDPYALGYQPWSLLAALVPLGGVLAWRRLNGALVVLALDVSAYALGLYANLWDALIDPLLVLAALAVVARQRLLPVIARAIR